MSDNPFQREIKRTGYMKGTQMRKLRTKVVFAGLTMTVLCYVAAYFYYKPGESETFRFSQKEREWRTERNRKYSEIVELKTKLLTEREKVKGE